MAIEDIKPSCGACYFCHKYRDGDFGQCRAYPPVINKEKSVAEFPVVSLKWWCGAFAPDEAVFLGAVELDGVGNNV
jgi:hypothetical protein